MGNSSYYGSCIGVGVVVYIGGDKYYAGVSESGYDSAVISSRGMSIMPRAVVGIAVMG